MNRRRILHCFMWSLGLWALAAGLFVLGFVIKADGIMNLGTAVLSFGLMLLLVGVLFPLVVQGLFFHTVFRALLPAFKDTPVLSFFLDTEPPP
jgi:hypothetical protein